MSTEADAENKRRFWIAISALTVAVTVTVGTWVWSVARAAQSDRASLAAQRSTVGRPDPAEMRRQMLGRMAQDLGLTEAQKASVGKLQEEMWLEMERNRPQGEGDRAKMRERMDKARQKQDAQMAKILTAEQFEKFMTLQRQRGPGRGGPQMGGRGMGGPPMGGGPGGRMSPPGGMPSGGMMPPGGPNTN